MLFAELLTEEYEPEKPKHDAMYEISSPHGGTIWRFTDFAEFQSTFESAKQFLSQRQEFTADPAAYCKLARDAVANEDALMERWCLFEDILFNELCASGQATIFASRWDPDVGELDTEPRPIPESFFAHPVDMHFGAGVLYPEPPVIPDGVGIVGYREARPIYFLPVMPRADVLLAREKFLETLGTASAPKQRRGRKPTQRENAGQAIRELYPDGWPETEKQEAILAEVNDKLRADGKPVVDLRTLRRAAGKL